MYINAAFRIKNRPFSLSKVLMFSSDDTLSERQENQPEITQQTFPEEVMIPETSGATQLDAPPSKEDTPKLDFSSNTKKKISLKAGNEEEEA